MAKRYIQVVKVGDNYYEVDFCQAVLVSIGFLISFGIRCNVGVAVVKILTTPSEGGIPEFHWSPETIGNVDASYFWGYSVVNMSIARTYIVLDFIFEFVNISE